MRRRLPFASRLLDGIAYGVLLWFLRVAMQAASPWMMYSIPCSTLLYAATGGLVEMVALGVVSGSTGRRLRAAAGRETTMRPSRLGGFPVP